MCLTLARGLLAQALCSARQQGAFHLQDLRGRKFKRCFACGSKVLFLSVYFFFRSASEKRNTQKEKVPLRISTFGHHVSLVIERNSQNEHESTVLVPLQRASIF